MKKIHEMKLKVDYDLLKEYVITKERRSMYSPLTRSYFKRKRKGVKCIDDVYKALGFDMDEYNTDETVVRDRHRLFYAPVGVNTQCEYCIYCNSTTADRIRSFIRNNYTGLNVDTNKYLENVLAMDWLYISPITDETVEDDYIEIKRNKNFKDERNKGID